MALTLVNILLTFALTGVSGRCPAGQVCVEKTNCGKRDDNPTISSAGIACTRTVEETETSGKVCCPPVKKLAFSFNLIELSSN